MRWSIGTKIGSAFGLALVSMIVVGAVSYDSTTKLIESAEHRWRAVSAPTSSS